MLTGSCLCGGVAFRLVGDVGPVLACHCSMCAKTSGNYAAMAKSASADLQVTADATLRWYSSSPFVERGFCSRCGGNVFWKQKDSGDVYVTAGTVDKPTGLQVAEHIFAGSKADFYEISDGLPQKDEW